MRIVLIGPVYPYRGGIAHHTAQLARAGLSAGHELLLLSFQRQYPAWLYPGSSDKDPSQDGLTVEAEYLLDPLYPWTWFKTIQRVQSFGPQLVIIPWWTTFWGLAYAFLSRALKKSGIPVTYLIHNVIPHEARFFDQALAKLALSPAAGFVAQTPRERQRLLVLLPEARVEVCPHPISQLVKQSTLSKQEARAQAGVPEEVALLLFMGIVRPYKGLDVLLQALSVLDQEEQPVRLLVAGDFWEDRQRYEGRIQELGLAKRVVIDDRYVPDEEVADYFRAADLFVAPYTTGTQSAAVKLAVGFGLPVVVSEYILDPLLESLQGDGVYAARTGDPVSLAEAIRLALRETAAKAPYQNLPDDDGWEAMLAAAIRAAQGRYDGG
jgi:D-inositol-3-phosphate glycosyltransferase